MEEDVRVRFKTSGGLNGKTGTVIGEGSEGCAAIPDGTNLVLNFKREEIEPLPHNGPPPNLSGASPQPA